MNSRNTELAARLYAPSTATMTAELRHIGEAIFAAAGEAFQRPTVKSCDALLARICAAEHAVSRLRASLIAEAGQ